MTACKPDFGERPSVVTAERVIAVRAEPPEGPPGGAVTVTALVASPEGTVASPPLGWGFCASAKPIGENDVVSADCLGAGFRGEGTSPTLQAPLPDDACVLFGPEPPQGSRPRDADVTGGFYQPLRVQLGAAPTIALLRVSCKLSGVSADAAADLAKRYVANKNPTVALDAPTPVARGAHVTLHASWKTEDAEAYVAFDPVTQTVQNHRESMRASWFVSTGSVDTDRTGRDESDMATTTDVGWQAPDSPGTAHVWIVLRDARGGVAFTSADVAVR